MKKRLCADILTDMQNPVLIFDFDGTIADTFHAIVNISNRLADEFQFNKLTPDAAEKMKDNTLKETIRQLNVPFLKIPVIVGRAKDELLKEIAQIEPVPGLTEILLKFKELEIKMGILTSNSAQNVANFLKNHNLDLFAFVNTSSKIWSKNHNLQKMIESYDLKIDDVIYIGDEARDIDAARKLGIRVAAVTWGYNSAKALSAHKPDFLITRPEELLSLLL